MKIKLLNKIFIVLFIIICLVPFVGMLVFGGSPALANEIQSPAPKLTADDGSFNSEYLSQLSDYFADRFALRPRLITAWAKLNSAFFKTSTEDQVLLGNNGWLYYSSELDDYMGKSLEDSELETIAMNLAHIHNSLKSRDIKFVFTIAPNKSSLYPGNMPSYIPNNHENSNAEGLKPYLEKYGIVYADLFEAFEGSTILYYSTDSHWTAAGAAKGTDAILSAAGISTSYGEKPYAIEGTHTGDLYNMLYPAAAGAEGRVVSLEEFTYECLNDPNEGNAIKIETVNPNAEGSLFCWRDSFGIEMYPFLAQSFGEAEFSRDSEYNLGKIEEGTDLVILEIVERNLSNLLAPPVAAEQASSASADAAAENSDELMQAAAALIGEDVQKLYEAAGMPESSDYASSCLGSGKDGELYYPGFTVYTYAEGSLETIVDVEERKTFEKPEEEPEDEVSLNIDSDFAEAAELEELIKNIVSEQTDSSMTDEEKLEALYKYVVNSYTYRRRNYYDFGATGWVDEEAYTMLTTGKGNCYNFASVFCLLAREIGYDATAYSGTMGPDRRPHAWVEIEIDGETRLFDPEDDWTISIHGVLKKYNITLEKAERYKYIHE